MTELARSRLRGAASYALVAALSLVLGAAGTYLLRAGRPLDQITTHGEWVYVKRGADSIRAYVAYPERKTKAPAVIVIPRGPSAGCCRFRFHLLAATGTEFATNWTNAN